MLGDIAQVGVRYDSDSLDALVMISNKAKLVDHCPESLPSRKRRSFDDEASQTTGCLDVRVDRLREFLKVSFSSPDFGCTWRMECSVSRSYSIMYRSFYDRCGPTTGLTDGVDAHPSGREPSSSPSDSPCPPGGRDRSPQVRSRWSRGGSRLNRLEFPPCQSRRQAMDSAPRSPTTSGER